MALRPDLAEPHNNLAKVLREQGSSTRPRHAISKRSRSSPTMPRTQNLGNIRWRTRPSSTGHGAAVSAGAGPQAGHRRSAFPPSELKTFRPGDPDLAALEALAADPDRLPAGDRLFVHFALGKALEDTGDYERASSNGSRAMR